MLRERDTGGVATQDVGTRRFPTREAHKVTAFVLEHGHDLFAVACT
jgi:hypothetical protein